MASSRSPDLESRMKCLEEELTLLRNLKAEMTNYVRAARLTTQHSPNPVLTLWLDNASRIISYISWKLCTEIIRKASSTPPVPATSAASPPSPDEKESPRKKLRTMGLDKLQLRIVPEDHLKIRSSPQISNHTPTSNGQTISPDETTPATTVKIEPGQISDRWTNLKNQVKDGSEKTIRLVVRGKLIKTEIPEEEVETMEKEGVPQKEADPEARRTPRRTQTLNRLRENCKAEGILGLFQKQLPFIPWGTAKTDEDLDYQFTNTCSIDNSLMILTVLVVWYPKVADFLESQFHSFFLAEAIVDSLNFVKLGLFNTAKANWLKYVAQRPLLEKPEMNNCHGSEDELCASPISPLFRKYVVTHLCPVHGTVFTGQENICRFEHDKLSQILEAIHGKIVEPDLKCTKGCSIPIKMQVALPKGQEPLPFLVFHPIREESITSVPKKIMVLGTRYELLGASLHQRERDHFVAAFSWGRHWITYDGLQEKFHLELQDHDAVSLLWYVREQN